MVDILGYPREEFSMYTMISNLHPDDYVPTCETASLEFTNSLYFNDNFRFYTSYSYRMLTSSGKYVAVRQKFQALEVNKEGLLSKTLVIHEVLDYFEKRQPNDFRIIDRDTNKIVNIDNIDNIYNLTKREYEILQLVQQGLTSIEISEKLCLSKLTVDTHRKNILTKTRSTSFIELSNNIYK